MSISTRSRMACAIVTIAGSLVWASSACAMFSDPFFRVSASSINGSGTFMVPLSDVTMNPNGSAVYLLPAPVDIMDGTNLIATLTQITAFARPLSGGLPNTLGLAFTFRAGDSDTEFIVDSTLFTISPIIDEAANATAGVSITDQNGDGAMFSGANASGHAFRTAYNGASPGGTEFASVIGNFAADPAGSNRMDMSVPGGGLFTPIGDVQDMSSRWHFLLTATDQVGVTSGFNIIPGPGAISLIALGGLVAGRRRTR